MTRLFWLILAALIFGNDPASALAQVSGTGSASPTCSALGMSGTAPLCGFALSGDVTGTNTNTTVHGVFRNLSLMRGIAFNAAGDTSLTISVNLIPYVVQSIQIANCTGTLILATGAVYTGAGGTGSQLTPTTTFSAITGIGSLLTVAANAGSNSARQTGNTLYFRITTPNALAATCDVFVQGIDLAGPGGT